MDLKKMNPSGLDVNPNSFYEYELSRNIVNCAIEVRRQLGPHLLEGFYEDAFKTELELNGINCVTQYPVYRSYKGVRIDKPAFRIDLLVESKIIVELKAIRFLEGVEFRQLLSYMKLSGIRIGYLINFGAIDFRPATKKDGKNCELGIYRYVL